MLNNLFNIMSLLRSRIILSPSTLVKVNGVIQTDPREVAESFNRYFTSKALNWYYSSNLAIPEKFSIVASADEKVQETRGMETKQQLTPLERFLFWMVHGLQVVLLLVAQHTTTAPEGMLSRIGFKFITERTPRQATSRIFFP